MSIQDFSFLAYLPSEEGSQKVASFADFLTQEGLVWHDRHISLPDGGLTCAMQFYPSRTTKDISIVRLDCGGVYFDEFLPEESDSETTLMLPFLQTWHTYLRWCADVCTHFTPLFGFGYGLLEDRSGDVERMCVEALDRGQIPQFNADILSAPPFAQYVAERFLGEHPIQEWYEMGFIIQRLPPGGAFLISPQRASGKVTR